MRQVWSWMTEMPRRTPYGIISAMLMVSPTKGYFVGYADWGDNTLYAFNPTTGAVSGAVPGFQNINISSMHGGTYLDKNDMMWVCDATNVRHQNRGYGG